MKKKPRNGEPREPLDSFTIPKDSDMVVRQNKITSYTQISLLPHGDNIDMTILLSVSSCLIYFVTEMLVFLGYSPASDIHLSYIWSMVVLVYCFKFLGYMLKVYIQLGGGERSLVALSTFLFVVIALFVSMADKRYIDFGVEEGYSDFIDEFVKFANTTNLIESRSDLNIPSTKAFKGALIIISGLIGALLTFPSFRFGALNSKILHSSGKTGPTEGPSATGNGSTTSDHENESDKGNSFRDRLVLLLVHFNLISPILIVLCWCKPLVQDHIQSQADISDHTFALLRIGFIAAIMMIRVVSIKLYLQAHLDSAQLYLRHLKQEAGRVEHKTIQQKIAFTFQYSSVIVLQILTPAFIILQLCFLLVSLQNTPDILTPSKSTILAGVSDVLPEIMSSGNVNMVRGIRVVLTKSFMTSVVSYLVWWMTSVMSVVTLFSTAYHHVSEQV